MTFYTPEINPYFETDIPYVNTVIWENQAQYVRIITDIVNQINGYDGKSVISENGKIVSFEKHCEVLDKFFPFEINRKPLLTKIASELEKNAVSADYYERTMQLTADFERLLGELSFPLPCDIVYPKLTISSLIKAAAPELRDEYACISEKILDYMELVREFDRSKLFFTVNLRSFLSNDEAELFMQDVVSHGFHLMMFENREYPKCQMEKRLIVDKDLCEIT